MCHSDDYPSDLHSLHSVHWWKFILLLMLIDTTVLSGIPTIWHIRYSGDIELLFWWYWLFWYSDTWWVFGVVCCCTLTWYSLQAIVDGRLRAVLRHWPVPLFDDDDTILMEIVTVPVDDSMTLCIVLPLTIPVFVRCGMIDLDRAVFLIPFGILVLPGGIRWWWADHYRWCGIRTTWLACWPYLLPVFPSVMEVRPDLFVYVVVVLHLFVCSVSVVGDDYIQEATFDYLVMWCILLFCRLLVPFIDAVVLERRCFDLLFCCFSSCCCSCGDEWCICWCSVEAVPSTLMHSFVVVHSVFRCILVRCSLPAEAFWSTPILFCRCGDCALLIYFCILPLMEWVMVMGGGCACSFTVIDSLWPVVPLWPFPLLFWFWCLWYIVLRSVDDVELVPGAPLRYWSTFHVVLICCSPTRLLPTVIWWLFVFLRLLVPLRALMEQWWYRWHRYVDYLHYLLMGLVFILRCCWLRLLFSDTPLLMLFLQYSADVTTFLIYCWCIHSLFCYIPVLFWYIDAIVIDTVFWLSEISIYSMHSRVRVGERCCRD